MACALVDAHDGFLRRPGGKAEDLAGIGVEPRLREMHALAGLDREIPVVGLLELLCRHPEEAGVDIHELRHCILLVWLIGSIPTRTIDSEGAHAIGRATDAIPI